MISRSQLTEDVTLFRGVPGARYEKQLERSLSSGKPIEDHAFMSTSTSQSGVSTAMKDTGVKGSYNLLEIKAGAGANALPVHAFESNFKFGQYKPSEGEYLLPRGTALQIIGKREENGRTIYVASLASKFRKADGDSDPFTVDFSSVGVKVKADLAAVFKEAADNFASELSIDPFLDVDVWAADWAAEHAAELVTNLEMTTVERLRDRVVAAFEEGLDPNELKEDLMDSFDFSDDRAEMIARTELATAQGEGGMKAARESGVATGKKWILGSEHGDPDECDDNEVAGVIDIDDEFPSGDDTVPAHPHCVCDCVIVVDRDAED